MRDLTHTILEVLDRPWNLKDITTQPGVKEALVGLSIQLTDVEIYRTEQGDDIFIRGQFRPGLVEIHHGYLDSEGVLRSGRSVSRASSGQGLLSTALFLVKRELRQGNAVRVVADKETIPVYRSVADKIIAKGFPAVLSDTKTMRRGKLGLDGKLYTFTVSQDKRPVIKLPR